jgi:hypothetical protein
MSTITLELITIAADGRHGKYSEEVTLGNENNVVIASEHYLCPHLSISIARDGYVQLTTYSAEDSLCETHAEEEYFINIGNELLVEIPSKGAETYDLGLDEVFSIVFVIKNVITKVIFGRRVSVSSAD